MTTTDDRLDALTASIDRLERLALLQAGATAQMSGAACLQPAQDLLAAVQADVRARDDDDG